MQSPISFTGDKNGILPKIHKLDMPKKVTKEEYIAIDILADSVQKKHCVTLPSIPLKREIFVKKFYIDEEIELESINLPNLTLFGYTFYPTRTYIIPCIVHWNKKLNAWETKSGGVPVRVEFRIV